MAAPIPTWVVVWFCVSMFSALAWDFSLRVYLRRRQVPFSRWWAGTFGYKEWKYAQWRRENGQLVGIIPWVSAAVHLNALAAGITFILHSP